MTVKLSRAQVRRVDQLAVEQLGISGVVLMENAGRNAAQLIQQKYTSPKPSLGRAFVMCGTGNNGGDGCVIARHLANAGWAVRTVVFGDAARMSPDMRTNFNVLVAMKLEPTVAVSSAEHRTILESIAADDVVIDSLLGTGFQGDMRSPMAAFIEGLNKAPKRAMVAIDLPSGLDCDTGKPSPATIRADLTITFVAQKIGFNAPTTQEYLGEVHVADIGTPPALVDVVQTTPD